jgi:small GTP-binding protein
MTSFTFKVLIAGPFGVGKTTLIQQISGVPVVGTEVATTGREALVKATTTVGIEYGVFHVHDGDIDVELLLFGTPGQERFSAVREIAARGMDGMIVLVDGTDRSTWAGAASLYRTFGANADVPVVVVVNRCDPDDPTPRGLLEVLGVDEHTPVVHGHVVDATDARRMLVELLTAVFDADEPALEATGDATEERKAV